MKKRLVWADIHLDNLHHNLSFLRSKIPPTTKLMAVLKANAYGHGALALARAIQTSKQADAIGVVCLYEALELRQAGITLPIVILNVIDPEGARIAIQNEITLTVMDETILAVVDSEAKKLGRKIPIHIKVDTGMHRAGILVKDLSSFLQNLEKYTHVEVEGLCTHFATADESDSTFTKIQLEQFNTAINLTRKKGLSIPLLHAANSAATLAFPESHYTMVRPGLALYGISPFAEDHPHYRESLHNLRPVLELKTTVMQVKEIKEGESVGYGRQFKAFRPTRIGLLPVGYADGFRRAPQNWGKVLVRGKYAPIIGRVSMDQTSIDVTNIPDVKYGDEVVLIGKQGEMTLSATDVANTLGTIPYEVLTSLAARVERLYIGE